MSTQRKNPTPSQIVLACTTLQALLLLFLLLAYQTYYKQPNPLWLLLIPAILFVVNYWILYSALENFIYRKIKNIYKSIHHFKQPEDYNNNSYPLNMDIVGVVEQEVEDWTTQKEEEITQLKKMEKFRKEYIGNVSHELKTPIFNVQGYISTLLDGGLYDNEVNYHYLKRADSNIERLASIVNELETISLHESGHLRLNISDFDVVKLIQETFEILSIHADARDIDLVIKEGFSNKILVTADRDKIQQVLVNLVSNSIKYGKKGGRTAVGFYDLEEHILMEVSDNGIGIDQKHLPRLFERFYRVDKSRSRDAGGTGLGLSIVKHIMEAHKQTVHVRSTINVGTTFGITLEKAK